jgi:hypothetical protein
MGAPNIIGPDNRPLLYYYYHHRTTTTTGHNMSGWGGLTSGNKERSCYPQNIGDKKKEEKHETYLKGVVSRQEYFLEDLIIDTFCGALKFLQFLVSYLMKKSHSKF